MKKYCQNCGNLIDPISNSCRSCGKKISTSRIVHSNDSGDIGWAILGVVIPLAGFILYITWQNEKPSDSKLAGIGALIGLILNIIIIFILITSLIYKID